MEPHEIFLQSQSFEKIVNMSITGSIYYLLLALCRVAELSKSPQDDSSIWVAKIKLMDNVLEDCIGVLIETNNLGYSNTIVSSASCFPLSPIKAEYRYRPAFEPEEYSIIFVDYSPDGKATGREIERNVSSITIHPNFEYNTREYDIAVIKLETEVSEIRPSVVSTYNSTNVDNCSLLALSIKTGSKEQPDFEELNLSGLKIGEGTNNIEWQVSNLASGKDFFARYASPLMCLRNGQFYIQDFAQGVNGNGFFRYGINVHNTSTLYFVDAAPMYNWIMNPNVTPSPPIVFHAGLAKVENEDQGSIVSRHNEYLWRVNKLSEKINVEQKNRSYIVKGHFDARNAYDCAIECFKSNQGNPCAYAKETQECYELQNCITDRDFVPNPAILIKFPTQCSIGSHLDEYCSGEQLCRNVVRNITGDYGKQISRMFNFYPKNGCSCDDGYARDFDYKHCIKEELCVQNEVDNAGKIYNAHLGYST